MNTVSVLRPEERCRRDTPTPDWADTVPACFRSEGFAEDLLESGATPPTSRAPQNPERNIEKRPRLAAQSAR